jgi:hypothetical protein
MNDLPREFKIPKITATHADSMKAVGLADLLQSVFEEPVEIRDEGSYFSVITPSALDERLRSIPHSPRYPWLKASPGEDSPLGVSTIDLSAEFQRVKRWSENRKKLAKAKPTDPELEQLVQNDAPRPRWWVLAALTSSKLKAIETWNRVASAIAETETGEFRQEVESSLKLLMEGKPSAAKWGASSSGLFCPSQIKGFNELKPQGTHKGSVPVDAFEEWLRYQGYWQCTNLVSSSDDIRIYVPIPGHITSRSLGRLASGMERESITGCGPKSDILATIVLARLLIEHSREYHAAAAETDPELSFPSGCTPAQLVSGVHVTHYTKTSQRAYGVLATSVLALPDWFPIRNREDAEDWLGALDEHQRVIRYLNPGDRETPPKNKSDEIGLLIDYRRFLQRRGESGPWALLEFVERYGMLVMRVNGLKHENRLRWMTRFSSDYLRRIIMGTERRLVEIVDDSGFDAVARAVREVTVKAQNKRARFRAKLSTQDTWREIRYELLHDIHRTRKVPGDAFIECVSEFISRYNYENVRHREEKKDPKAAPPNVSDEQLKSFLGLVDQYRAPVVGALLAAYGTCKEKWDVDGEDYSGASESGTNAQARESV